MTIGAINRFVIVGESPRIAQCSVVFWGDLPPQKIPNYSLLDDTSCATNQYFKRDVGATRRHCCDGIIDIHQYLAALLESNVCTQETNWCHRSRKTSSKEAFEISFRSALGE